MRRAFSVALLLTALASLARAQEDEPLPLAERRRAVREGTHVFRRILADAEVSPLDSFADLVKAPQRSLLIVLGDLSALDDIPGGLEKFVRDGGAVLLASDRAVTGRDTREQLIKTAGVTINRETLVGGRLDDRCYNRIPFCPLLLAWAPPHDNPLLTGGTSRRPGLPLTVATNTPSMLMLRYPSLDPPTPRLPVLATLPLGCLVEMPDGRHRPAIRGEDGDERGGVDVGNISKYPAFMVGGDVGAGRALVLADHSVFINEMMLPTDNQNVEFTYNVVAWLQGEGKARDRALLVEEGVIQTKFDIPVKPGTLPVDEALRLLFAKRNALLVKAEEKLTDLEDEAFYDNALIDWLSRKGLPPSRLGRWAAAVSAGALALLIIFRLALRHRFRHDTTAPSLVAAVSGNFPSRPLVEQRTRALLRRNNLSEPAAALVRQWFGGLGIDVAPGSDPPPFRVAGGWGARRRHARRLRALWELASGRSAAPVGGPQMWRLQRELEELGAARERGEWGLEQRNGARPEAPARSGG